MNRDKLVHVMRAIATISGHRNFVLVGSATVLLRAENIPAEMLNTNEIDVYSPDSPDEDAFADLIDGSIGRGSQFDKTFRYYGDGVSSRTSVMPTDWESRAKTVENLGLADVRVLVPDIDDIALAKTMAWRDKDRDWLRAGVQSKILSPAAMRQRAPLLPSTETPAAEIERRLAIVASYGGE